MATEEQIRQSLEKVLVPGAMRSLVKLNLVREIIISDQKVNITLASAALNSHAQEWLKTKVSEVTKKLPGINEVNIDYIQARPKEVNDVSHVIAVMSGKGGVGKSLVAALLSIALVRQGKEVGILDADITGPSIPKMFGLSNVRPGSSDTGIMPVLSKMGISIMSINLLLEHEDDALIGLVFFAGDSLGGGPNSTSWCDSPLRDFIPVNIVDKEPVTGVKSDIRIKDWSFPPFKGFDFSTLRVYKLTKVTAKPGATVVATAKLGGESHPILVWWERNGVRVVVWAGCFDDLYNWKNAEFWRTYGAKGGPLFARRLLYFAAQRREAEKPIPP
jgi:metal-sulfur cluster biosynthetic enzyme